MEFKSTNQTDKKLNELADFLESKIDMMKEVSTDYKENSNEYFFCDTCNDYIHGRKLEWRNDTPICPECESIINL